MTDSGGGVAREDEDTRWLMARELPRLRRFARVLRPDAGADDLVQDCLERALRKQTLWRQGTNMRAWLFRILYNVHLSGLRHERRDPAKVPLDEVSSSVSAGGAQVASVELSEMAHALDQLPRDQREVITLVALEGVSYDEAARILGINLGTVRSRLSRGRAALREFMAAAMVQADQPPSRLRRVK